MAYTRTTIEPPDYTFIPGGLNVGTQIIVRGRVACDQERFHINLQNENVDCGDIAFHFNPRTGNQTVVRSSYQGKWQNEELDIPFFPFTNGSKFTVKIYVGAESYKVLVNGQHFIEYKHRLPYKDVRYLKLSEGAEYYESTIQNLCHTPYKGEFHGGLKIGKAVRVRGFVNENAYRFAINFNCGKDDIVGFHFNPRQDQGVVVCNTKICSWQEEQRSQGCFPFQSGQYFDVHFIASDGHFNVYVNGKFFLSYAYRVPLGDIKYLDIHGDVTLKDVEFTDPLPNDYIKVIPSGLEDNDLIVVKGFFYPDGKRFSINLINGTCLDSDIALHFNPRHDQNEVILNNRECGIWQTEERYPLPCVLSDLLPFEVEIVNKCNKFSINLINGTCLDSDIALHFNPRHDQNEVILNNRECGIWQTEERYPLPCVLSDLLPFEVEIVNKCNKFKIYINGHYFASFKARSAIENIRSINVQGEAYIYEVKLLRRVCTPFVDELPSTFECGSWVTVYGTPKKCGDRFDINLQCGSDPNYECDIAFHFNPRFNEVVTVRNTKENGCWGKEEREEPNFPFKREDRFEISILRLPDVYRVFVNQQFYIDYAHRINPRCVCYVMLTGSCNFFEPMFH